jgi:hypothetical protein
MSEGEETDLSGRWAGLYTYPDGRPGIPFEADLRESAGRVTGTTTETGDTPASFGQTLRAVIDGRRDGRAIRFLKLYESSNDAYDVVHYEGTVRPGGDEIEGRWTIPGVWFGGFLMVRNAGRGATAEQAMREEAPVAP